MSPFFVQGCIDRILFPSGGGDNHFAVGRDSVLPSFFNFACHILQDLVEYFHKRKFLAKQKQKPSCKYSSKSFNTNSMLDHS